jgi:hypothetical protein
MHSDLSHLLSSFDPITLLEMEDVKLLDRIDTKFVFNYDRLEMILNSLQEHYKILDVNGIKQNKYETLYFDTADFKLYHDHHNGRTCRYKVRYRKYVDSNLIFFEVKYKNNKGRTIKSRVKLKTIDDVIVGPATDLINEKTPFSSEILESKLWVNYSRITLVNKITTERLTLDLDLQFKNDEDQILYKNIVIAEVKQAKLGPSPFLNVMKNNHVREGSISKYCFGIISLIKDIKKNNFKSSLLTLNKICHATNN